MFGKYYTQTGVVMSIAKASRERRSMLQGKRVSGKSFAARAVGLSMLKDVKDMCQAEINADSNEDDTRQPTNPPFDLCESVKSLSNRLSTKG